MFICDISVLNRYGKHRLDEMLHPLGIDWHMLVALLVIHQVPGISQAELIPFLQTDKGNVTKLLQMMEEKNLIKRETHGEDKRNKVCFCTEEGRVMAPRLYEILNLWEDGCFQGIPREDLRLFRKVNEAVKQNLMKEWELPGHYRCGKG